MPDLKTSAERLLDAVAALEAHLTAERAIAQEAGRRVRRLRKRMRAQMVEAKVAADTVTAKDATIAELHAKLASAGDEVAASHEGSQAALQAAEAERDALRDAAETSGDNAEMLAAAELARDQAIAAAEDMAVERDEALARVAELETARSGDAKLREEAAEALDAAIGELKTLSGGAANG